MMVSQVYRSHFLILLKMASRLPRRNSRIRTSGNGFPAIRKCLKCSPNPVLPAKIPFPFFTKSGIPAIKSSILLNSAWRLEPPLLRTPSLPRNASPNSISTGIPTTTPDAIHKQTACNLGNGPLYSGVKKALKTSHGHSNSLRGQKSNRRKPEADSPASFPTVKRMIKVSAFMLGPLFTTTSPSP